MYAEAEFKFDWSNALKKLKDNNLVIIKVINYKRTIYLSNEVRNKLLDV